LKIAVVDIGTNSIRLLISEISTGTIAGPVHNVVVTGLVSTRLGEGIGKNAYLLRPAMERTFDALTGFRELTEQHGAERVIAAATSAVRDAANRQEFLELVRERTGWDVRVLSGLEEAEMSYLGVIHGLKKSVDAPVVIDIGGGSTEFIWPAAGSVKCISLRLGAVRMTEQDAKISDIREILDETLSSIASAGGKNLIGVGGTITTLAAIDLQMAVYDRSRVHGYCLKKETIAGILRDLEGMTVRQRQQIPGLQPERADIVVAGARIALTAVEGLQTPGITVSETDIMYGLLYREWEKFKKTP